jgi:hypothetical protein
MKLTPPEENAGDTMRIEDRTFHCRYCGRQFPGSLWQELIDRMRRDGHESTNLVYCSEQCMDDDGWVPV